MQIEYIDFNCQFMEMKWCVKYLFFLKYGIYWVFNSGIMVIDFIFGCIQKGLYMCLDMLIGENLYVGLVEKEDKDIGNGMNLLINFLENLLYFDIRWVRREDSCWINVVVIVDSYFWIFWYYGIFISFKEIQYWFYNQELNFFDLLKYGNVVDFDFGCEMENNQVFIIMVMEVNLFNFGFGFIEQVYDYFKVWFQYLFLILVK